MLIFANGFIIAVAVLPLPLHCCSVTFIVTVSCSLLWCHIHCCGVTFVVVVSHSLLHCHGVKLIGTAKRAVTTKPEALRMGALAF